jgi:hypothetical protein
MELPIYRGPLRLAVVVARFYELGKVRQGIAVSVPAESGCAGNIRDESGDFDLARVGEFYR